MANILLLPAGGLFFAAAALRRALYRVGIFRTHKIPVPVAVVGNIVVGGGGKTPLTAELASQFRLAGLSPGIVSRGYGGREDGEVMMVEDDSDWRMCGDEPLMLRRKTGLPVCAGANRVEAARTLAEQGCDVIVSDDGLQHLALGRDLEICAAQADYRNGNGWPLPSGPLREPASRMGRRDLIAVFGEGEAAEWGVQEEKFFAGFKLEGSGFFAVDGSGSRFSVEEIFGRRVAAFAGLARPGRFFAQLRGLGIYPAPEIGLPDHGRMADEWGWIPPDCEWILTTEKDAVKYEGERRILALETRAILPPHFVSAALSALKKIGAT